MDRHSLNQKFAQELTSEGRCRNICPFTPIRISGVIVITIESNITSVMFGSSNDRTDFCHAISPHKNLAAVVITAVSFVIIFRFAIPAEVIDCASRWQLA